ncbi:MAG: recombination mediator RecR [Bacteroidota bacterium]
MISSKFIEQAVNEISSLQGVGKRTALRYVLDLAGRSKEDLDRFIASIEKLRDKVKTCKKCHNLSDHDICEICTSKKRDESIICIVEDIRDILAIENTHQYQGLYHVLGGKISPMDGIGPSDLNIATLLARVRNEEIKELILALSATMEGDTTAYYINKKLEKLENIVISTLSRGVPVGDELQYTDEVTLGRSIAQRTPYDKSLL